MIAAGQIPSCRTRPSTANVKLVQECVGALTSLHECKPAASIPRALERDVFRQREAEYQRVAVAIFGHEADGLGQPQLAFCDERSPRERSQRLSLPCPFDRREPDDLASTNRKIHISNGDQSPVIQHINTRGGYNDATNRSIRWSACPSATNPRRASRREAIRCHGTRGGVQRDSAAAKHCHVVGDAQRFVQLVGDENDGVSAIGEPPEPPQQFIGFGRGENRCWLVEYQRLCIARQRLYDLQSLLSADRQIRGTRDRVEDQSAAERRCRSLDGSAAIDSAASSAERDVLRDGHAPARL